MRKRTRSSARLLTDVAVFLLVTAVLLVLVEAGARWLLRDPSDDALRLVEGGDAVSQTLAFLDINLVPLDKDVDLLWRPRPNVRKTQPVNPRAFGRNDEWTIVSNARGFRDTAPPPSEKPPNELRILCIGDSVTYGFNVDQAAAYPEQLQAELRRRYPGRPVRVINAGTPGWSWLQGVRFLEREGLALQPDIVVMAHGANDRFFPAKITDAERIGALERPASRWVERVRLLLERASTYRLVQRWFAPPPKDDAGKVSPGCRRQIAATRNCRRVALDEIEDAIMAAARLTRDAGVDLAVLNVDFEQTDARDAIRGGAQRANVPFVDMVAEFQRRRVAAEDSRARALGLSPTRMEKPSRQRQVETHALFRVVVPPGASSVRVDGWFMFSAVAFGADLHDDGGGGDEVAGDGVWSGRIAMAPNSVLDYRFSRDGVGELEGLPPLASTHGTRKRQVVGDAILPVEVFGDLYLMAERMHPNGEGQALVAEGILGVLPMLPSFARWSAAETRAGKSH